MPPAQIKSGQIIALFAFDVGYELDLQLLETKLLSTDLQPASGKKGSPLHDKRAPSRPRILPMEDATPLFSDAGRTQATFYEFGCISIRFCWSLGQNVRTIEDLPQLSQRLYALDLEMQARERVSELTTKIKTAITHPHLSPLVEDYYLFIIEELTQPLSSEELYQQHHADFAQTLRFETAPLSLVQQEEATNSKISYYSNDLVLLDWNAALIYDPDYADTANLFERPQCRVAGSALFGRAIRQKPHGIQAFGPHPATMVLSFANALQKSRAGFRGAAD